MSTVTPQTHEQACAPVLDCVSVDVEAGKIREFARATGSTDPIHTDPTVASAAGFDHVPATPTYVVVAGHQRNQHEFVAALGLAIERVVVGAVDWTYSRLLVAGDRITGTRRVIDDVVKDGKRGGSMRLVTLQTSWVDAAGEVVMMQREVLIERGET